VGFGIDGGTVGQAFQPDPGLDWLENLISFLVWLESLTYGKVALAARFW
jgi:hypothetical protein